MKVSILLAESDLSFGQWLLETITELRIEKTHISYTFLSSASSVA